MPKSGQARTLTVAQRKHLFAVIQQHRHAEKNTAIMQLSFKLGLRVQEIALLQIKEVAKLDPIARTKSVTRGFQIHEVLALPAAYTKGADAMRRSTSTYQRTSLTFTKNEFDKTIRTVVKLAKKGASVEPEDYYPEIKQHKGTSRDLPLVDKPLRQALSDYLMLRLSAHPKLKRTNTLFITQKGGPYSPNTLQEHMALMLRSWAGIEKATSHSGRRTVITDIIHVQKKTVKVAQKVAGHKNPSTTIIYEEPPEEEIGEALKNIK